MSAPTFDACAAALGTELLAAWSAAGDWREQLSAAIGAALGFAIAAPLQARFLLFDAPTAGSALLATQRAAGERLAKALFEARRASVRTADSRGDVEEMVVAGIAWRIGRALLDAEPLEPLEPELLELALAPYPGAG